MWGEGPPKIRLFRTYPDHIPPQGSNGLAPSYSLREQSWCLTLGPQDLSHHSPAPCILEMPAATSRGSSIGIQVSPELSGCATATGAERSGLGYICGLAYVCCVCLCTCVCVMKMGTRAEAATWDGTGWRRKPGNRNHLPYQCLRWPESCTWSKVNPHRKKTCLARGFLKGMEIDFLLVHTGAILLYHSAC